MNKMWRENLYDHHFSLRVIVACGARLSNATHASQSPQSNTRGSTI